MSLVEPRELIKALCLSNASSFLMLHNHPGGSLSPSNQDVEITDRMHRIGSLIHIPLVDHIIVVPGSDRYFSFKDQGILTFSEPKMETDYRNIHITDIVAAEGEEKTEEELVAKLATSGMEDEEPDEEETPSFCLS